MQNHEGARDCYKKAAELDPTNEAFARNLAIAEQAVQADASSQQPSNPLAGLCEAWNLSQ